MTVKMPRRGASRRTQLQSSSQPTTNSDYNVRLRRPKGVPPEDAFTALGRAAKEGRRQRRRRGKEKDFSWQQPRHARSPNAARRSAFASSRSGWQALTPVEAHIDVACFEEMLLIRDQRRMREQGSRYLEQLALEHPDQPQRVASAARRLFAAFKPPIPLTARGLFVVLRYALTTDLRIAIAATRALILQYPGSAYTPPAMLAAASIQRHLGHCDKSTKTLWNLVETYPDSVAGTKAVALLTG